MLLLSLFGQVVFLVELLLVGLVKCQVLESHTFLSFRFRNFNI